MFKFHSVKTLAATPHSCIVSTANLKDKLIKTLNTLRDSISTRLLKMPYCPLLWVARLEKVME